MGPSCSTESELTLHANATGIYHSRDDGKTAFLEPRSISYDPARVNADESMVVNLRLGVQTGNGLDLSAFVDNLLNCDARTSRNHDHPNSTLFKDTSLRPRTIGFTATYRY